MPLWLRRKRLTQVTEQPDKALVFYTQALPLYRQVGDKKGEAHTLNFMGKVYVKAGQSQKALESQEQALSLYRQMGDKREEAWILAEIGYAYEKAGQLQKASEFYEQSLFLRKQLGDKISSLLDLKM